MSQQRLEAGSLEAGRLVNVQGNSKENGIGNVVEVFRDDRGQIVECTIKFSAGPREKVPIEHISLFSYDTVGKRKRTLTSSGAAAKAAAAATATVPAPALVRPKALKERSQNVKPPAKKQKPAPPPPQPQPAPVVVVVEEHSGLNLTVLSGSSGGGEEEEEDDNSSGEQEESQPCTEREIDAFRGKLNALLTGVRVEQSAALALHPQSPRQARALLQQLHDDGLFFINEGFVYRV